MALDNALHIRSESARLTEVLAVADPAARVPTCPEWTAADLLWHLAEVQSFWAVVVGERLQSAEPAEAAAPARPAGHDDLVALSRRATEALLSALAGAGDDEPVWTWAAEGNVGFVRTWQVHEALMHRLDAELTVGAVTPVDPALAAEGIRVVVEHAFSWAPDWPEFRQLGGVGLLDPSDGAPVVVRTVGWSGTSPDTGKVHADETILRLADGETPTFTVRGSAEALDRWVWGRGADDALVFEGNP